MEIIDKEEKLEDKKHLYQKYTISQWYLKVFIFISLSFCIVLIPIILHLRNVFEELQLEKSKQQFDNGISQISTSVAGLVNMSNILTEDSRFLALRYRGVDYSDLDVTILNQLRDSIDNQTFPYELFSHVALLVSQDVAITDDDIFWGDYICYYPDFFSVNDLSYTEWTQLLSDCKTGFLPICRVNAKNKEYDALVFCVPWINDTYIYACADIADIKKTLIEGSCLNDCYLSIIGADGTLLYSDLPDTKIRCKEISKEVFYGKCQITVHISNSVFTKKMRPFYFFIGTYLFFCMIMLIFISLTGKKASEGPLVYIMGVLERCRNIVQINSTPTDKSEHIIRHQKYGINHITDGILHMSKHLEEYENLLYTQEKIIKDRLMEKAIGGYLFIDKDVQQFLFYFSDFLEGYRLLQFRLSTKAENTVLPYSDPLLLIRVFIENELPNAYVQTVDEEELLMLISEEDFENYCQNLNFLINNINQQEPCYAARCIASQKYHHIENISSAYKKLQTTNDTFIFDYQLYIYSDDDNKGSSEPPFTILEIQNLYTVITTGNGEMAMKILYSMSQKIMQEKNRSFGSVAGEFVRVMLNYVIQEHFDILSEEMVPVYQQNRTIYDQFKESVATFCDAINKASKKQKDPFTEELFNYIDNHYTDCDFCISSLKTHFNCSESVIRKAFKSVTDVTVARYIEQKRMELANELLVQNQKSIAEIALECGYTLPHSFYKAYKRVYGHAPSVQRVEN